jgi:hypothetical protein
MGGTFSAQWKNGIYLPKFGRKISSEEITWETWVYLEE